MSWFSGIVSGVKTVLGVSSDGSSNVMKAATGIGNWIDEQKFTDQEKSETNMKIFGMFSKFMDSTASENTQRSKTRRDMSLLIIRVELLFLALSIVFYKIDSELSEYIYKVATDSPLGMLTLGVGAFFWGTHLLRATKGK